MASFGAVSQTELGRRRQSLQHQWRARSAAVVWQMLAASAHGRRFAVVDCPAGLVNCPIGTSEGGGQSVAVGQGGAVFMPLSYPQSLWGTQPRASPKAGVHGAIAKAKVTRNWFPPG